MIAIRSPRSSRPPVDVFDDDPWSRFTLRSVSEIRAHVKGILVAMATQDYTVSDGFAVQLAVSEALVNAIRHGNLEDPRKVVHFSYLVLEDEVWVEIEDQGRGFDPDHLPDPTTPENIGRTHGRGVFLMRSYMHSVKFTDGGRRVLMQRKRGPLPDQLPT